MEKITSRHNTKIKLARQLSSSAKARRQFDLTIFDGVSFALEYLKKYQAEMIFITEKMIPKMAGRDVIIVPNDLLDYLSPVKHSSGVVIIAKTPEEQKLDVSNQNILLLDRIQDSGNLGAICRLALAFDYRAILLSDKSVDAYHPEVIRASAGAVFGLNIYQKVDLIEFIHRQTHHSVATNLDAKVDLKELTLTSPTAWVFGNEGQGISAEILSLIPNQVKINHSKEVESLNLATSVAICLYQA